MNRLIDLERAIQGVIENHGCTCRECEFAWHVLHRIPDHGGGIRYPPNIRRIPEARHD